ncbi:MAG: cation transporter, partial [Bacteroidales bacterium]
MATHTHNHEHKTKWVVMLTAVTMVVEIIFGLTTRSMALLADGIHMGSHVFAIGLSWLAYVMVRRLAANQ